MSPVVHREMLKQKELTVRVATLELLVADLVHALRQVAPDVVEALGAEAVLDRDGQMCHDMPPGAEHQRFRLHQVLDERARRLGYRRFSDKLRRQRCEPTD